VAERLADSNLLRSESFIQYVAIDGAWKMLCNKGCGWNELHTTKYHDEQRWSAATFKVPPNHLFWLLSGKAWAALVQL
jgi:hypothetical protein